MGVLLWLREVDIAVALETFVLVVVEVVEEVDA
jgi:hypothetical protein